MKILGSVEEVDVRIAWRRRRLGARLAALLALKRAAEGIKRRLTEFGTIDDGSEDHDRA